MKVPFRRRSWRVIRPGMILGRTVLALALASLIEVKQFFTPIRAGSPGQAVMARAPVSLARICKRRRWNSPNAEYERWYHRCLSK